MCAKSYARMQTPGSNRVHRGSRYPAKKEDASTAPEHLKTGSQGASNNTLTCDQNHSPSSACARGLHTLSARLETMAPSSYWGTVPANHLFDLEGLIKARIVQQRQADQRDSSAKTCKDALYAIPIFAAEWATARLNVTYSDC